MHHGYTADPALSIGVDEPEALDDEALQDMADKARERFEELRADELLRRKMRSLKAKLTVAGKKGTDGLAEMNGVLKEMEGVQKQLRERAEAVA
jgi:hypothetical protein